ncbi:hypothetical protein BH18THE2_BH18THE2_17790 [soil metagenome]
MRSKIVALNDMVPTISLEAFLVISAASSEAFCTIDVIPILSALS